MFLKTKTGRITEETIELHLSGENIRSNEFKVQEIIT